MSAVERIPVEIIEHIIDMLYDDHNALKACSLVCHGWLTRARCNLFTELKLDFHAMNRISDLEEEIAFFRQSAISLPLLIVRSLKITGGNLSFGILSWPCWVELKNLTTLCLHHFEDLDNDLPSFLDHLFSLQCLDIKYARFDSAFSILGILQKIPHLLELSLYEVGWIKVQIPAEKQGVLDPIPLRHLTLNEIQDLHQFVDIFLMMYPDLHLWSVWTDNLDSDRRFMFECCESLRTVDLRYHGASSFDITTYISMRTLVMPDASYGLIPVDFFGSITSKTFRHLVLFLNLLSPQDLVKSNCDTFDWDIIDRGISTSHPSALVLLVVEGLEKADFGELSWADLTAAFSEFLPCCIGRGAVKLLPHDAPIWSDLHVYI